MIALLCFFLTLLTSPFKSNSRLQAENAALRRQVIVLQRRVSSRVQLTNDDRLFLVMLYRQFRSVLGPSRSSGPPRQLWRIRPELTSHTRDIAERSAVFASARSAP